MLVKFSDSDHNSTLFSNLHDQSAFLSTLRQGGGVLLLTRGPTSQRFRLSEQPTIESFGVGISLVVAVNFRPRRLFPSRRFAVEFLYRLPQGRMARTILEE